MNDRLEIASRLLAAHAAQPVNSQVRDPGVDVIAKWALEVTDILIARERETRKEGQT